MVNALFFKVGLGGAVATTAGTVGIVYKDKIKDFFAQLSSKTSTYVIAKTTTSAVDSTITKNLYENGKKNFKCQITKDEKTVDDETCEIFEIKAATTGKFNNLDDIQKSKTYATKEKMTSDNLFKLTISDSFLSVMKWDGTQTIDIVSKEEGNNDKKYGSFTLQYKVTDDLVVEGKTDLIIGRVKTKTLSGNLDASPTFKCSLNGEDTKVDCALFKITPSITDKTIKDITTTEIQQATQTATDYDENKYFVIDLKRKTAKKDISNFSGKTITVEVTSGTSNTAVGTFEFKAALSDTSATDFSTSNLSKIIFV